MLISQSSCRFVEGMAPVFSRSAWHCAWHLIQVIFGVHLKLISFAQKLIPTIMSKSCITFSSSFLNTFFVTMPESVLRFANKF